MSQSMRLFLVRHGETVDNVAQLYAGSRDSALTNHGYQQATRLGLHLKSLGLSFTHIFSSHLQRAATTAGLIREAQLAPRPNGSPAQAVPDVVRLPVLMEQDFGSYEGKKWNEQPLRNSKSGFVDIETKESMAQRADTFLDGHLLPLLDSSTESTDHVVAVVSHGILLSVLWKRLLQRLPPKSVAVAPELLVNAPVSVERLVGWANTGYLELHLTLPVVQEAGIAADVPPPVAPKTISPDSEGPASSAGVGSTKASQAVANNKVTVEENSESSTSPPVPVTLPSPKIIAHGWKTLIVTINGKDHLRGLKRTLGGVGSSRYDASQKNIHSFFKRQKLE